MSLAALGLLCLTSCLPEGRRQRQPVSPDIEKEFPPIEVEEIPFSLDRKLSELLIEAVRDGETDTVQIFSRYRFRSQYF